MNVCLISSLYGMAGGGAGILVQNLAHGLRDYGHKVSVITLGDRRQYSSSDENGILIYRFQPANLYPLIEKETHPFWQKVFWQILDIYNVHGARTLKTILKRETPDVIHIHKMRGLSGAVWSTASELFPGRVIQTCHDYESMSPDGLLRGPIGQMALNGRWPVRAYQILRARLSAGISQITAPSRFTLERIIRSGLFPNAQGQVIVNTHGWSIPELQSFHANELVTGSSRCQFLYLGRLEQEKGVVELCEAFRRASILYPRIDLEIAGWGSLDAFLREKYQSVPEIKFLGSLNGAEKVNALFKASVVIIPSLVEEVFGIVTIEAFAFGKPVIASNIGGLPELVRPGETGWLVQAGDIESLSQIIIQAAELDDANRMRMSQVCMDVSHEYSLEKILAKYLALYEQLQR